MVMWVYKKNANSPAKTASRETERVEAESDMIVRVLSRSVSSVMMTSRRLFPRKLSTSKDSAAGIVVPGEPTT